MSAPRVGRACASACSSSASEVEKRGLPVVHAGGRDAEHARRRARRLRVLLEQMRGLVLEQLARRARRRLDVDAVGALLDGVHRHLLLVVARRPLARDDAVLPAVPGAHHELAAHPAFRKRPALVVASAAMARKRAVVEEHCDRSALHAHEHGTRASNSSRVPIRCQVVVVTSLSVDVQTFSTVRGGRTEALPAPLLPRRGAQAISPRYRVFP